MNNSAPIEYRCGIKSKLIPHKKNVKMNNLRDQFLLDPTVIFLNHGSFGATPRPVFDVYQAWQRRIERQPVQFFQRDINPLLNDARRVLADFVGTAADNLVYVPNATFATNIVARSLVLQPGDEILTTNHEYGACLNALDYAVAKSGAQIVRRTLPLPADDRAALAHDFLRGITPQTRVIFMSHITSPTALCLPVEEICHAARSRNIITVVDGAHAPGQLALNLDALGADFYLGNAHKWLCAPKGAGFLYAHPDVQSTVQPLVVGWGWGALRNMDFGSTFLNGQQYLGTNDLSAYLSVPAAIDFLAHHDWPRQRARCHQLLQQTLDELYAWSGAPRLAVNDAWYAQMGVARLPHLDDPSRVQATLLADYAIEVPILRFEESTFVRISVQAYNSAADLARLVQALQAEVPLS